jgi:hypothetical protein
MRAWAIFDIHGTCDDRIFKSALHSAHSASDEALGAHILTFWAAAAYNCDQPAEAESIASAALSAVRGKAAPRVQALVHARRARARSHLGDGRCWSDLDLAERNLHRAEQSPDDDEPEWAYWMNLAEFQGSRASTQLTMGRPGDAEATFAAAARAFDGGAVRDHALYLTRQADAQWRQGHHEQACGTAHQAWTSPSRSARSARLAPCRAWSPPWPRTAVFRPYGTCANGSQPSPDAVRRRDRPGQTMGGRPARVSRHTVRHDIGRRSPASPRNPSTNPLNHTPRFPEDRKRQTLITIQTAR